MHSRIFSAIRRLAVETGLQKAWEWVANRYCWSAFPPAIEVRNRLLQITGLTRSGKTLLGAILDTHPEVLMLHEPYHQWLYRILWRRQRGKPVVRASGATAFGTGRLARPMDRLRRTLPQPRFRPLGQPVFLRTQPSARHSNPRDDSRSPGHLDRNCHTNS